MGLGEPLDNYHTTLSSIDILAEGLNLSRNKILVSTVGLADRMREFIAAKKAKLALSLHATTDQVGYEGAQHCGLQPASASPLFVRVHLSWSAYVVCVIVCMRVCVCVCVTCLWRVQVRDWIVPVNKRYPISELLSILRENFPVGAK